MRAARQGIDMDRIRGRQGDTDLIGGGNGTGGSRSIPEGGVACDRTAEAVIAKGKRVAAQVLEAAEADIAYAVGRFTIVGTDTGTAIGDVPRVAPDPQNLPAGATPGLDVQKQHPAQALTLRHRWHLYVAETHSTIAGRRNLH